ncbi:MULTISPECIES: 3-carboxy-cis,cis-muconate cycloisomerase [unclassified Streptomyces]|uniref:3-carboxy-cis,cis-muconate cycloisomerase n=1 Tax=unclassified Streptomyces TaxID=2593676 RepID=UPI002DD9B38D|nr:MULTISPECIES: 3-carboxy-cis,cis-muconate cycloisomerase [unclassified Streptomyces]WSC40355.1 3-carboxy-cis,cis-muconate cycloisomerase [Streptomyces sp. NBC_01763]WSC48497.1 3-carboxy-cis,cis-muconate cycloisomerase [Streptomyces sp. NBC_01762]WSC52538.1 3-carboxy-cis,cis-muconate cycloisomerase [Streptomyces sp. NBC_01761]WSD28149.1 3-carboxy-cis,cis-muconate cycloisomerase [Streptomyces sp. NBC_01751]
MYESDAGLLAPGRAGSPAEATTGDSAFLQAMLDAEAALTRAQSACGLAPADAGRAVTETADADRFDVRDLALRARSGGNPVIPLVADLTAAVPEDARPYVHRGATSQDILDTAAMLVASRTLATVLEDLERAAGEVARHATTHRDTQMAGRTLTQHAVPTTFGLKAAGWRALILDARDRLTAVRASLPAQLGGAAGTLAAFSAFSAPSVAQEDADGQGEADLLALVAAYARELGLAEPALPWHTLRTPIADLAGALAFTAGALGKMAADVLTLSRTEIGEVEEEEWGGSSALPHKANPVHATLIAAAARRAPGLAATLYGSLTAEDERPAGAWHAEWEPLRDLLRLVGGAARDGAALAAGLRVVPYAMRENLQLTDGLIVSERLAAVFAGRIGRTRAREVLSGAADRARSETADLSDVLFDVLREEPELAGLDLAELTDPTRYTGSAGLLTDRALERR